MEKVLELVFITDDGKTSRLTVNDPKEPIELENVKNAMESIIRSNVFMSSSGPFVSIKEARLVERKVETYEFDSLD